MSTSPKPAILGTLGPDVARAATPGDGEDLVASCRWQDKVFVFKQSRYFVFFGTVDATGDGVPLFEFTPVEAQAGAGGVRAACAGRDGVYFVCERGVYFTTGDAPQLISFGLDPLFRGISPTWFTGRTGDPAAMDEATICWVDELLYVGIPAAGSGRVTLVYDPRTQWWGYDDMPLLAGAPVRYGGSDQLVLSSPGIHGVRRHGRDLFDDDGVMIPVAWRSGWHDFGESRRQACPADEAARRRDVRGQLRDGPRAAQYGGRRGCGPHGSLGRRLCSGRPLGGGRERVGPLGDGAGYPEGVGPPHPDSGSSVVVGPLPGRQPVGSFRPGRGTSSERPAAPAGDGHDCGCCLMLLNYATTLVPLTPENVGDLNVLLGQIKQSVNNIEDENVAAGAAIDYSKLDLSGSIKNSDLDPNANISPGKLADMEDGEIIVGDGGAGKVVALHGAIKVDDQGLAYHDKIHKLQTPSPQTIASNTGAAIANCGDTLSSGFYECWGTAEVTAVSGSAIVFCQIDLVYGLAVVGRNAHHISAGAFTRYEQDVSAKDVQMNGSTPINLAVTCGVFPGGQFDVAKGQLYVRRVN